MYKADIFNVFGGICDRRVVSDFDLVGQRMVKRSMCETTNFYYKNKLNIGI